VNPIAKGSSLKARGLFLGGLLCGVIAGGGATFLWRKPGAGDGPSDSGATFSFPSILREAHADLEDGDYEFFPNRRSVWIVNRTNGRMATYHFRDDEQGSVDRSRVSAIDLKTFPRKDTVITLSDRNMNNILWVCNSRTGDVQMWTIARDASLRAETPIASSTDLMDRASAKAGPR
jgi:hypothetical protein